jgi:hypothetical protein
MQLVSPEVGDRFLNVIDINIRPSDVKNFQDSCGDN